MTMPWWGWVLVIAAACVISGLIGAAACLLWIGSGMFR